MSRTDTKARIVRTLRRTDEPALSAKTLADKLDVSVRTINNHVDDLEADDKVATTQIGNATAYYIPFEDLPNHNKPDHTCARCGREVDELHDFAKLDSTTYFSGGNRDPGIADFSVFCRFCYADFINWVEEPASVGDYPFVHRWDIPDEQLEEVRADPEIETAPGKPEVLDEVPQQVYALLKEMEDDYQQGVPRHELLQQGENEGFQQREVDEAVQTLRKGGFVHRPVALQYRTAK